MHERLPELLKNSGYSDNPQSTGRSTSTTGGSGASQDSVLNQAITNATQNIAALTTTTQASAESLSANTEALARSTSSRESSSSGVTGAVTQAVSGLTSGGGILGGGLLGGGLGLLFDGIKSLFGSGSSQPPALVQYMPPSQQNFELATSQGGIGDAVYNANGQPRAADLTQLAFTGIQGSGAPATSGSSPGGAGQGLNTSNQSVTVQVQAMDSRSFLDHSQDIAMAVRQAMLNMHSINDVVNDL